MILISNVTHTVRLYSQCDYPKRINGNFAIRDSGIDVDGLSIAEGHVNKAGKPQRLISFEDVSSNMHLSNRLRSVRSREVKIYDETARFLFAVERVAVEVVGTSEEDRIEQPYRGLVHLADDTDVTLVLYEPESTGSRTFYLDAAPEVLLVEPNLYDLAAKIFLPRVASCFDGDSWS